MAYVPNSGSVLAFQGTVPWSVLGNTSVSGVIGASIIGIPTVQTGNTSVITIIQGSVAVAITPAANQSVSGTVGASVIGTVPVVQSGINITSVVSTVPSSVLVGASIFGQLPGGTATLGSIATLQGTNPWIITGSVQGSFTPSGNQSVSGTVGASVIGAVPVNIQGSVATVIIGGSIAASFTPPANQSVSGTVNIGTGGPVSVVGTMSVLGTVPVTQSTTPWIITGSVQGSFAPAANQSVSGTVGASIIGLTPVSVSNFPTTQNVSGSVVATQGTNPWTVVSSLAGGIFPISGSVAATITNANINVSGSVVAFQGGAPWANTNVGSIITVGQGSIAAVIIGGSIAASFTPAGNQSVSGTVGASIIGLPPVNVTNTNLNVSGSVAAWLQSTNASVITVGTPVPNQSVSGTVGASIIGLAPVNMFVTATTSGTDNQTYLQTQVPGTILSSPVPTAGFVFNGTNWDRARGNSSIGTLINTGTSSVVTILQTPSIVGTYAEDAPSASGDKGFLVMGARNDTLSSITSADGDYSSHVVGPAGELIAANAPITAWVSGVNSIVSGASVALLAAPATSVFTYVTGLQIVNPSANNITGNLSTGAGAASILVYFTAPANGGSNMIFPNPLKGRAAQAILASISGVGSVLLSAQGFTAKT